jgi:hypothetical protein
MRRHLTYANVAATLALVFAMSGGALAAKHYLINSTRQINPKVLRKLKGARGKTGATGAQGKQGGQGAAGTTGAQGPTGPSNAYTAVNTAFTNMKFPENVTLASVAVPAGSYLVSAKVQGIDETKERVALGCELVHDGSEPVDQSSVTLEPIGGTSYDGRGVVALQTAATLASPGHWELNCGSSSKTETMKVDEAQLAAVQVGSLSRIGS